MSKPNIPNTILDMDISFEDAINMLLISIAMEEISLSRLLDAETEKIKLIINEQKKINISDSDILSIKANMNSIIINISKMQMLLQWNLENMSWILRSKPPCPGT